MAYTVTRQDTVIGNKRMAICEVTADAASGQVTVPFTVIDGFSLAPKSMATAAIKMAASAGTVTVSNAANGDAFFLTVYGR